MGRMLIVEFDDKEKNYLMILCSIITMFLAFKK